LARGPVESMGSKTVPPSTPGILMAYSTRWVLPGMVATSV